MMESPEVARTGEDILIEAASGLNQNVENLGEVGNMESLDSLERIKILIDDLNSEDTNIKYNALTKLIIVANYIGDERVREELVPMITDMIDRVDDNAELLLVIAEQLGLFVNAVGDPKYLPLLVKPLEIIASNDDPVAREKAVESLILIGQSMTQEQHINEFLPLFKRLAKGDMFSMRVAACGLFAVSYSNLSALNQSALRQLFTELAQDDTPMVRRAAAQQIGKIAGVMESYLISSELFPLLSELLSDEQDGVRVTAIESTPAVGKLCPHKSLEAHLLPGIARCARDKKSWRVRFAVAENTRNILPFLESGAISEVVLEYMMALLEDKEPEVRSQAIIQVHALCHYASTQSVILKIIPIFEKSLEKDSSEHVRAALAEKICDIGGMLGKETVMAHILPIVMNLLKDEISEVRLSLLKNLDAIIKILGEEDIETYIVPALQEVAEDKQWRIRLALLEYIPDITGYIDLPTFIKHILPIFMNFLQDKVYKIRQEATIQLIKLRKHFGQEWFENTIWDKIREFQNHEKFTYRINTLFCISLLKEEFSVEFIMEKLLPVLKDMKNDPVPNIRFNVAKLLEKMGDCFNENTMHEIVIPILQSMSNDDDFDVRYFVDKALLSQHISQFVY